MLTLENYKNGFLIDHEWMASINLTEEGIQAYVVNHANAEVIAARKFDSLDAAIQAVNAIPRQWAYESASSCGGCSKNEANGGKCPAGGICKKC